MSLDTKHPLYVEFIEDWTLCRDAYAGERQVKNKGEVYLPKTQSMEDDLAEGSKAYEAYKLRAVFHEHMGDAVSASLGALHQKEAEIKLPAQMEPMRKVASLEEESLIQVLHRINTEQLIAGRIGVLVDFPANPDPDRMNLPYLATYFTETIINWDEGRRGMTKELVMAVLNESGVKRINGFEWKDHKTYRVLMLGSGDPESLGESPIYTQGVFSSDETSAADFSMEMMKAPTSSQGTLGRIPFTFINRSSLCSTPDDPPLVGLCRLSMAIYRGEADYRQGLFLQSQDTLVVRGGDPDETYRTGAGAVINLPETGDAKYIGVNSQGLSEQRQALENDKNRADRLTGRLIHAEKTDRESGQALKARQAAQSATLVLIALTGAAGLERSLKQAAVWIGANPEEVSVAPNLDFTSDTMSADEVLKLITANQMRAPLSKESIHKLLRDKGLTELDFEEEMRKVMADTADLGDRGMDEEDDSDDREEDDDERQ